MNCPECGKYIPVSFDKCPNCGYESLEDDSHDTQSSDIGTPRERESKRKLSEPQPIIDAEVVIEPPRINAPRDNATKKCPYCAETIRLEAIICRYCHMNLKTGRPVSTDADAGDVVFNIFKYGCALIIGLPLFTFFILLILLRSC